MPELRELELIDPRLVLERFSEHDFSAGPEGTVPLQQAIGRVMLQGGVSACAGLETVQYSAVVNGDPEQTGNPDDAEVTVHAEISAHYARTATPQWSWVDGSVTVSYVERGVRRLDTVSLADGRFATKAVSGRSAGSDPEVLADQMNAIREGQYSACFNQGRVFDIQDERIQRVMAIATRVLNNCGLDRTATQAYSEPANIAVRVTHDYIIPIDFRWLRRLRI